MSKVWWIRHVESEANAGLSTLDSIEVKITKRGQRQAEVIAQSISAKPSLIVTSSYARAKQTSQPTRQRFPYVLQEEWPVHEFTYLALPRQLSTKEERRPFVEKFWARNDPEYVDGEGAESFSQFIGRVEEVFGRLNRLDNEAFIVIFSHGQFIRAISWRLQYGSFPTDMQQFRMFLDKDPLQNGEVLKYPSWRRNIHYPAKSQNSRPSLLNSAYKLLDTVGVVLV